MVGVSDVTAVSEAPAHALRVLMIAPTSFFADYGCHVRILEEARYLRDAGYKVVVCTYHLGRDPEGILIHRSRGVPWRTDYEVGSSRHKIAMDILLTARAISSMREFHPDIIHGHIHEGSLIGMLLSRLYSCPLVCDLQGSLSGEMVDHHFVHAGGLMHRFFRWIEGMIDRSATRILTSTMLYSELLPNKFGCNPERITYVPDCVNTNVFSPKSRDASWLAYRQALGIPASRKVVVYLGLLAEYQGTDHLLKSAALLCSRRTDIHFLIAGFPNTDHYRQMAVELGIADQCTFTGKIPYDDAPDILAQGDVAVSPKLSATEGAGKLLNYMAMGLPIVSFDTAVGHEYLGDLGVYAATGDSGDLARCIELVLDDPVYVDLGRQLRQKACDRYDWALSGKLITQAYVNELARSPSSNRSP